MIVLAQCLLILLTFTALAWFAGRLLGLNKIWKEGKEKINKTSVFL
jgi:hypothetical protein